MYVRGLRLYGSAWLKSKKITRGNVYRRRDFRQFDFLQSPVCAPRGKYTFNGHGMNAWSIRTNRIGNLGDPTLAPRPPPLEFFNVSSGAATSASLALSSPLLSLVGHRRDRSSLVSVSYRFINYYYNFLFFFVFFASQRCRDLTYPVGGTEPRHGSPTVVSVPPRWSDFVFFFFPFAISSRHALASATGPSVRSPPYGPSGRENLEPTTTTRTSVRTLAASATSSCRRFCTREYDTTIRRHVVVHTRPCRRPVFSVRDVCDHVEKRFFFFLLFIRSRAPDSS